MWFKGSAHIFPEGGLDYLGDPGLIHAQSLVGILACQGVLMGAAEAYHMAGGPLGEGLDTLFRGEAFEPFGLAEDPDTLRWAAGKPDQQNGQLATVSIFGC